MRICLLIAILTLLTISCNKKKKFANIPKITFRALDTNRVKAGSEQMVAITFYFEDGDGNIGFGTPNLFLRDSRDTGWIPYVIPDMPEKFNPDKGLEGTIQIDYQAAFLLLRPDTTHANSDTLTWDIYMKDEADNKSNIITTSPLVLLK